MKKYCLTNCAKEKLSTAWTLIIQGTAAVLALIVGSTLLMAILAGLGWIYEAIFAAFEWSHKIPTTFEGYAFFGLAGTFIIICALVLFFWIFLLLRWLFLGIKGILTNQVNRYQGNDYVKCKIFEVCETGEQHES